MNRVHQVAGCSALMKPLLDFMSAEKKKQVNKY